MKNKGKQIAAICCIIILVGFYIATLVAAVFDFPDSERLFAACLFATVALPILLWIYMWLYKKVADRKAEAAEYKKNSTEGAVESESDKK